MRLVHFFLNISIEILIDIYSINIHIFEKERMTINTILSFYLFAAHNHLDIIILLYFK